MRFAVRPLAPLFAAVAVATVTIAFLSRPAAGQETTKPKTDKPPATAAPPIPPPPSAEAPAPAATAPTAEAADPQPLIDKGEAALKAGDFPVAIAAFNQALRAAQQAGGENAGKFQVAAVLGRSRAQMGLKEYDAAEKDIRTILAENSVESPNPAAAAIGVSATIALGQLKLESGHPDEAVDQFQSAAKADPANFEALFGYGKSLYLLQHSDEAIGPLSRAIAVDSKNAEAFRLRGSSYSDVHKFKQAQEDLQQAIQLNPDDYENYFALGALDLRKEDYQGSVEQFGKAIEHYKPKPGFEDQPYLQGYLTRASAYIELGKVTTDPAAQKAAYQASYDEVQKLVKQLDAKNPAQNVWMSTSLYSRGIAERMLGQLGTAIRSFTQAIELRATSVLDETTAKFLAELYYRRGICFHFIGEDKMAISDFESASHLTSNDPRANLWEGFTYAKLGKYQEALRAYGDAIAASDRYTYAYYNRGLSYMMLGEYTKAIVDFNDAIRLEPANAEYYFKRGIAYEQLGERQRASESFSAAIEFDKKHAGAHRHMADVLQQLGRTELANQYRQKADQLAPPKKST